MNGPNLADVETAAAGIASFVYRTPVLTSRSLNDLAGCELYFKCENFQVCGAFKARGAMNAVLNLPSAVDSVVTHSSGNHGTALAWAASTTGRKAYIVVPKDAPAFKRDAIARYGATIVECDATLESRETTLEGFRRTNDATFIPPYDDVRVIAGQGTATMELLKQIEGLDQIWAPIGGGGLASGAIVAANGVCEVIGSEPELARDAFDSMRAGRLLPALPPMTVADGLRSSLGENTFRILHGNQTQIFLCSEDEIRAALRLVWERLKVVIEPSSAVPLAAILSNPGIANGRVGVILSGGNVSYPGD